MIDHLKLIDDRRASEREATLEWAQLVFPDGITTTTCTILNVSKHGALIQVDPIEELPREFSLVRDRDHLLLPCTTRWRIGGQIGVLFIEAISDDPANGNWLFPLGDHRRPKEIRSPFLRHPLMIC